MKNDNAKDVIVDLLQKSLIGQLQPPSKFNPNHVADAIIDKINFEKEYMNVGHERLIIFINSEKNEMKNQLHLLSDNELLLKNFIRGRITSYDIVLNFLKS